MHIKVGDNVKLSRLIMTCILQHYNLEIDVFNLALFSVKVIKKVKIYDINYIGYVYTVKFNIGECIIMHCDENDIVNVVSFDCIDDSDDIIKNIQDLF